MKLYHFLFISAIILIGWASRTMGGDGKQDMKELRIGLIPDENPGEIVRKNEPLKLYLEEKTGMEVTLVVPMNYAAVVEAMANKQIEMAYYGGFTYVQARNKAPVLPVVMRFQDVNFHSYFITRKDSEILSLEDLKGKTFAFGDINSTSGSLMPRYYLKENGLAPERDFAKVIYTGGHDATAFAVAKGKVDAGALNENVFHKMVKQGLLDKNDIKIIWTTPGYVDYNWTVRSDLDREIVTKIAKAFLDLNKTKPRDKEILELLHAEGYILAYDDDFQKIREAAWDAGLMKTLSQKQPLNFKFVRE